MNKFGSMIVRMSLNLHIIKDMGMIYLFYFNLLTTVKDHMLVCDQPVPFDDFKVLHSSNSEFHLKIKESLLISRDQLVLNKNESSLPLHLFD